MTVAPTMPVEAARSAPTITTAYPRPPRTRAKSLLARLPFNRKRFDRAVENIMWCFPEWDESRAGSA